MLFVVIWTHLSEWLSTREVTSLAILTRALIEASNQEASFHHRLSSSVGSSSADWAALRPPEITVFSRFEDDLSPVQTWQFRVTLQLLSAVSAQRWQISR